MFQPNIGPYILPGDEELLRDRDCYCHVTNWEHYISDSNFGVPGDKRFHLGLLPQPFKGDVESESVDVKPGTSPT